MPARDSAAQRLLLTEMARFVRSDAWPLVLPWFRERMVSRMLDVQSTAERDDLAAKWQAGAELLTAMENEVSTNQELIDGRSTRYRSKRSK